ncbi:MAG: cupin domain-containing protein [Chloroflexi bacterium]|nr:cupin domain-containing protein [Chloroflexota bacterium]
MTEQKNIFAGLPDARSGEVTDVLTESRNTRIERIVSRGQASAPGFWYDQEQHEWVVVLRGRARLRIERDETELLLRPGDYVNIPAHVRHRVEWTDPDQDTVWLAVHYT